MHQYVHSRGGDTGEVPLENMTPMANQNVNNANRTPSPTSPERGDIEFKSPPKAEAEVAPDVEEAPLVKHHAGTPLEPAKPGSKPVTLTFQDLKYSVQIKNPKKQTSSDPNYVQRDILKGMTGVCRPRELTAIMGASGAGKTTLLNILSCRVDPKGKKNRLSGSILANAQSYDIAKFSKFAGYVMQNDILLETMTPREIFMFTASLRLNASPEERLKKVNRLIQDLKLERAADTQVGGTFSKGISGGERKRTSIGVELITDPNLIFLDEPTSGLDSFTAFILITLLKSMAVHGGKTIIFTIHQPSSDIFFLFDNLMILAKGKFIYQGPTRFAVPHFGKIGYQCPEYSNPADYFIEVAHSDQDEDKKFELMYQAYDENIAPQIEEEAKNVQHKEIALAEKVNSFWTCLGLIAKRSFLNFVRNPILLKGRIGQSAFIILLICILYFRISKDMDGTSLTSPANIQVIYDINGAIFFYSITQFMSSAMSVVLTFPAERAVFLREYSANMYSVSAYYFGRSTTEVPFVVLFPALMSFISYYIVGFNDANAGKPFIFALILIFVSLAGNATGILVGSVFSDAKVATNVVPVILLPWMIFSGFYINSNSMPNWLGWFQYTSPFRYALESLFWNQYTDFELGTGVVEQYGFHLGLWGAFGLLAAVGLVARAAALFALKVLVKKLE